MNSPLIRVRWVAACVLAVVSPVLCGAQQEFPLRPGEWEVTSKATADGQPYSVRFCINNETWKKALMQNPVCSLQKLSITSRGISYFLDCPMKTAQIRGPVELIFDGMEHMTGKASIGVTSGGKTTNTQALTDYRWKNAACSSADVNMRPRALR